jgi:hypothetical protein
MPLIRLRNAQTSTSVRYPGFDSDGSQYTHEHTFDRVSARSIGDMRGASNSPRALIDRSWLSTESR